MAKMLKKIQNKVSKRTNHKVSNYTNRKLSMYKNVISDSNIINGNVGGDVIINKISNNYENCDSFSSIRELTDQGVEFFKKKEYELALDKFLDAIKMLDKSDKLYFYSFAILKRNIADTFLRMDNLSSAIDSINSAIKMLEMNLSCSDDVCEKFDVIQLIIEFKVSLGNCYLEASNYDSEAYKTFDETLKFISSNCVKNTFERFKKLDLYYRAHIVILDNMTLTFDTDLNKKLDYKLKVLKIYDDNNLTKDIKYYTICTNVATIYYTMNKRDEFLQYYGISPQNTMEDGETVEFEAQSSEIDTYFISIICLHDLLGENTEASEYLNHLISYIKVFEESSFKSNGNLIVLKALLAEYYIKLNDIDNTLFYCNEIYEELKYVNIKKMDLKFTVYLKVGDMFYCLEEVEKCRTMYKYIVESIGKDVFNGSSIVENKEYLIPACLKLSLSYLYNNEFNEAKHFITKAKKEAILANYFDIYENIINVISAHLEYLNDCNIFDNNVLYEGYINEINTCISKQPEI